MATEKQRQAARKNIKKAQAKWERMLSSEHSKSQPEGRDRRKPATKGTGNYYHVEVRPNEGFTAFRTQDVGSRGHIQRVAGRRSSGSWATTKWLISKEDAHVENSKLVGDTRDAKDLLKKLGSEPVRSRGDLFEAKDRGSVPGRGKPTAAQKRAPRQSARKAQNKRRRKS